MPTSVWTVVVYLVTDRKLSFSVGNEQDAREYARNIQREGPFICDSRGVKTYYPVHQVFKVKVVPPGIELEETETDAD